MNKGIFKRLSIVLTIIYFVGVTVWQAYAIITPQEEYANNNYVWCKEQPDAVEAVCWARVNQEFDQISISSGFRDGALIAGATALAIWLLIGSIYYVVRWVSAGRTTDNSRS